MMQLSIVHKVGVTVVLVLSAMRVSKADPEFQVNTYTASWQRNPSVAMDAVGNFVVAWESNGQDGSEEGVYGQRYGALGNPLGAEFQVNTYTTSWQEAPSVAMDAHGDFVIVWHSWGQDGSEYGVYGQRYSTAGVAQGAEFPVNTSTEGRQCVPSVAMDANGNFLVVWESGSDIHGQRYGALGDPLGTEFIVNTTKADWQYAPSVAMDANGDFVVAWHSFGQEASGSGIYGQRFSEAGAKQGGEFHVNTYTDGDQDASSVAMDAGGDFVVTWQSAGQDGSGYGIYGQRYDAAGVAQGTEFRINTYTSGDQMRPWVASDAVGSFVVAWTSEGQDGDAFGIYGQRFSAAGVKQGSEFQMSTYTASLQYAPSVAMDQRGDFVAAWQSWGQDGSDYGIYGTQGVIPEPLSIAFMASAFVGVVGWRLRRRAERR
jgi:hypothetical protein